MIEQREIELPRFRRGFHLITSLITKAFPQLPKTGLMHIMVKHTSAGITINENVESSVRLDFESFFTKLIPEGEDIYLHSSEGEDDMPAHIKSSILGAEVTIPITNHRLNLGIWQGVYFCEFRNHPGHRRIVITIYS